MPVLTSIGLIISGILSLFLVKRNLDVRFVWQSKFNLCTQLKEGWHVFVSSLAISIYTISTTVLLGVFSNNVIVGYFAGADKIVQVVKSAYASVAQAIYPFTSRRIHDDRTTGILYVFKLIWFIGICMFLVSLVLFLFSEQIVEIILGGNFKQSVILLRIMAFLPFIISLSNLFGIQTILNLGYKREFSLMVLVTAILGLTLAIILTRYFEAIGISIAMLLTELFITVLLGIFVFFNVKRSTF